jgi:DNA adenine methylase
LKSLSPLRYPGGKSRACLKLIEYLPKDVKTICSPFFGGGSLELYCLMSYGIDVYGYDLSEPLTTFWNCLLEDPEALATIVAGYLPVVTKDQFYILQKRFLQIEDQLQIAAATYVLNRTSFSGSIMSGGFSPLEKDGRNGRFKESNVKFLRDFTVLEGMLSVRHLSFDASIPLHSEIFVYADPPYLVGSKLYGNRGDLHDIDHILLADILQSRDNWMLSYNDCPEVRRLYRGFHIVDEFDGLSWRYGMSKSKNSRELLILSHDVVERLGLNLSSRISAGRRRHAQDIVPLIT